LQTKEAKSDILPPSFVSRYRATKKKRKSLPLLREKKSLRRKACHEGKKSVITGKTVRWEAGRLYPATKRGKKSIAGRRVGIWWGGRKDCGPANTTGVGYSHRPEGDTANIAWRVVATSKRKKGGKKMGASSTCRKKGGYISRKRRGTPNYHLERVCV